MRLLALFVGLVVVAATQAASDLAAICAKAADAPKSEDGKDAYTHICQLQLEMLELKDAVNQLISERNMAVEEVESAIPEEIDAPSAEKRKNEFIRFGKRKNEFISFGRSASAEEPMEKEEMMKRKNEFIRFG